MCGIVGVIGQRNIDLDKLKTVQGHRGPDNFGFYQHENVWLVHNRLSIIDLSDQANQPFFDDSGRYVIIFNGEIYNYVELKKKLTDYPYKTKSDTEVILAAYLKWGKDCLQYFVGMFAFAIWDTQAETLFAARDRFGVKPFHYSFINGDFLFASEIKTLFAMGVDKQYSVSTWSTYLDYGMYDHTNATFWHNVNRLPPGAYLDYSCKNGLRISTWYDLPAIIQESGTDERNLNDIEEELYALLIDSVKLRFRADVPVGVLLSGGLDSSLLYGIIQKIFGKNNDVSTFSFYANDEAYDERPWIMELLNYKTDNSYFCELRAEDVPRLSQEVFNYQDEPFGGFPTLAFSLLHNKAKEVGIKVLLDGNGIDEGWAGYDYYERAESVDMRKGPVQSSSSKFSLSGCLSPDFKQLSALHDFPKISDDFLVNLQYRDISFAKIPRAMRFADRVSMSYSRELREPFLDHRIIELGLRQPVSNKIRKGVSKFLIREVSKKFIVNNVSSANKRPVQTPQREWLRVQLKDWVDLQLQTIKESDLKVWFDIKEMEKVWQIYQSEPIDNSFPIWQLLSVALMLTYKES